MKAKVNLLRIVWFCWLALVELIVVGSRVARQDFHRSPTFRQFPVAAGSASYPPAAVQKCVNVITSATIV